MAPPYSGQNPLPANDEPVFEIKTDRSGIGFTLQREDFPGDTLGGIGIFYRTGPLKDNGPLVIVTVDKMDGTSCDLDALLIDSLMDAHSVITLTAKGGDQGRVDVHDSSFVVIGIMIIGEKTGENDQSGFKRSQDVIDGL